MFTYTYTWALFLEIYQCFLILTNVIVLSVVAAAVAVVVVVVAVVVGVVVVVDDVFIVAAAVHGKPAPEWTQQVSL